MTQILCHNACCLFCDVRVDADDTTDRNLTTPPPGSYEGLNGAAGGRPLRTYLSLHPQFTRKLRLTAVAVDDAGGLTQEGHREPSK